MTATVGHADAVSTQAQQNNNLHHESGRGSARFPLDRHSRKKRGSGPRKRPIPTRPDACQRRSHRSTIGQRQWARARFSRARFPVNWRAHRSRMRAATPRMSLSVARKHNLAKTTTVGHAVVGRTQAQKTTIPHGSGRGSARFPLDWAQLKTQAGPADAPGSHSTRRIDAFQRRSHRSTSRQKQWAWARFTRPDPSRLDDRRAHRSRMRPASCRLEEREPHLHHQKRQQVMNLEAYNQWIWSHATNLESCPIPCRLESGGPGRRCVLGRPGHLEEVGPQKHRENRHREKRQRMNAARVRQRTWRRLQRRRQRSRTDSGGRLPRASGLHQGRQCSKRACPNKKRPRGLAREPLV